jgi:hypothetical protein
VTDDAATAGTTSGPGQDINAIQAQIAAQIASVTSMLHKQQAEPDSRKISYRTLRLDSQGREIDEKGNVIKVSGPVKTLAANVAETYASKKKENPYLMIPKPDIDELELETIDGRIRLANREIKAKKAFSFVEAGKERNELHFVTCFKSKRVICFVGF